MTVASRIQHDCPGAPNNDDNVRSYFTYNRFKTRVARSSMANFAMIAVAVFLFIMVRGEHLGITAPLTIALTVFVTFANLTLTAWFLWNEIANTTYRKAGSLWNE